MGLVCFGSDADSDGLVILFISKLNGRHWERELFQMHFELPPTHSKRSRVDEFWWQSTTLTDALLWLWARNDVVFVNLKPLANIWLCMHYLLKYWYCVVQASYFVAIHNPIAHSTSHIQTASARKQYIVATMVRRIGLSQSASQMEFECLNIHGYIRSSAIVKCCRNFRRSFESI